MTQEEGIKYQRIEMRLSLKVKFCKAVVDIDRELLKEKIGEKHFRKIDMKYKKNSSLEKFE